MLKEAIAELKGKEESEELRDPDIELKLDAYIPAEYIRDEKQKIEIYKKIRSVRTLEEARDLEEEIEDRFGDLPEPVRHLLWVARIRAYAIKYGIEQVEQEKGEIVIRFSPDQNERIDAARLIRLTHEIPERRVRLSSGRRVGIVFKVQGMEQGSALAMIERFLEKYETVLKKKGEMRHVQ
jgi:transcription-repair coupling factor (superfamily II helicase)